MRRISLRIKVKASFNPTKSACKVKVTPPLIYITLVISLVDMRLNHHPSCN